MLLLPPADEKNILQSSRLTFFYTGGTCLLAAPAHHSGAPCNTHRFLGACALFCPYSPFPLNLFCSFRDVLLDEQTYEAKKHRMRPSWQQDYDVSVRLSTLNHDEVTNICLWCFVTPLVLQRTPFSCGSSDCTWGSCASRSTWCTPPSC